MRKPKTHSYFEPRERCALTTGSVGSRLRREDGTSLISPVCEGNEPRGHARKRLMQAA